MKTFMLALATFFTATSVLAATPNYYCESADKELNLAPIVITVTSTKSVTVGAIVTGQALTPDTLTQKDADGTPNNYVRFFATVGCSQTGKFAHCMAIRLETLMVNQSMFSGAYTSDAILNGANYSCTMQMMAD